MKKRPGVGALEARMVLHAYMCRQFGFETLPAMLHHVAAESRTERVHGPHGAAEIIGLHVAANSCPVTEKVFMNYDENLREDGRQLGIGDTADRNWKPFQYICLLFCERYFDLFFQDAEALRNELNKWKRQKTSSGQLARDIPDYEDGDLNTVAIQSATGSGKTLLLHANLLQYRRHLAVDGRRRRLNRIILLTPNEGLSRQHVEALMQSGIGARLFADENEGQLFAGSGAMVDVIDLHKLGFERGVKTVALGAFEENNLVLVDEGHLGVGGDAWRRYRRVLARNGFTIEYSATFNQVASKTGVAGRKIRDEYGKCTLFDYSYRYFHADGYGKDYRIVNVRAGEGDEATDVYLLGALLTFYQQCRVFHDRNPGWRRYMLSPPLWVFLGRTVTGGRAKKYRATEADIVRIIRFFARVLKDERTAVDIVGRLMDGRSGIVDERNREIFAGTLPYLKSETPQNVWDDARATVFHGKGRLRVTYLTGSDELHLSTGEGRPFGVVNVGEAIGVYNRLANVEGPEFGLEKHAFRKALFPHLDDPGSPVTVVIGARRFVAGWNSWRVSTMGLMHVGTGEGPQIIQMFGRGVRLKGLEMSLKRHAALDEVPPPDGDLLRLLETLNVFGLRATYMEKFQEYLKKEGATVDQRLFEIPTTVQIEGGRSLKIVRKREAAGRFEMADELFELPGEPEPTDYVREDYYPAVEIVESGNIGEGIARTKKERGKLDDLWNRGWINFARVYWEIVERKRRHEWHNMLIPPAVVRQLLSQDGWYEIYIPPERLKLTKIERLREWEELAIDLVCQYARNVWRRRRSEWEHGHVEVAVLDTADHNVVQRYKVTVDEDATELIKEVENFMERIADGSYVDLAFEDVKLSVLTGRFLAFIPLLHLSEQNKVRITPASLNDGEVCFVRTVKAAVTTGSRGVLAGKELILMRNQSRGRGLSFFDDYEFYPDFVLWINGAGRQDVVFVDPKGLSRFDAKVEKKVELHKNIKRTENRIRKSHPDLHLHSYIWSVTSPQDIGTTRKMGPKECRERGIYLASGGEEEILAMLEDALS